MKQFEVGKSYWFAESGYDPIKVLKRTTKMITVTNGNHSWRMLIKTDDNGYEYVVDSSMGKRSRDMVTCSAKWEA